jgi:hypothetical protein
MAASYYGRPRTTIDIDFIIQISLSDLNVLLKHLARFGLKINRTRIKRQLSSGYNHQPRGQTLSLPRRPHNPDRGKLEKRPGRALGLRSYYHTPELLILSKLRMIKATVPSERSQKDREDIRAILANTRVKKRKIIDRARKESTIEIFREIIRPVQTQRKGNRAVRLHDNSVKTLQRSERGSLPRLKPFVREKHDRFD